jgi:hypothetical protein
MSPGPTNIEDPTFLAILQTILAVLEDDVAPLIPENTYLTLVSQLQILYGIHNNSGRGIYTYDNSGNYYTRVGRLTGIVSNSNSNNVTNVSNISNVTNFTDSLSIVERMYDSMSYVERERAYENNNYTNLMNTARNYWNAMSSDEQREYRTNMRRNEIEFGGPVHRIIYPRS